MKTLAFLGILILLGLCALAQVDDGLYYYFDGERVELLVDSTKLFVKLDVTSAAAIDALLDNYPDMAFDSSKQVSVEGFLLFDLNSADDFGSLLGALSTQANVRLANPVILAYGTVPNYIGETFVCRFRSAISRDEINQILNTYGIELVDSSTVIENELLLKVTGTSGISVIDAANFFHELPAVEFSHPNFYAPIVPDGYVVNDAYYAYQWNIKKVVSIPQYNNAAWEITKGHSSVAVAVIDEGIENHEDFSPTRFLSGYDFVDDDTIPAPTDSIEEHGMACAGLIFALHNNTLPYPELPKVDAEYASVAGMAPDCSAIPIRLLPPDTTEISEFEVAQAFSFAWHNGAGVINNSWTWFGNQNDVMNSAIDSATTCGRNGKGTVIVFSAGNYNDSSGYTILWPKTKDNVLAISAINSNDIRLSSSCYGTGLDFMAPSSISGCDKYGQTYVGIWSTDRMDTLGSNPYLCDACRNPNDVDYLCIAGATSAAAPLVTGTAALLLSRRPDLTAQQVMTVLKHSCVGELAWGKIKQSDQNTEYGWGRINALRSLLAVCRGDANNDGAINIGDMVYLNNYIYHGGPAPKPHPLMGDANCSGSVNVADVTYLNNYIYSGGPAPQICYEY